MRAIELGQRFIVSGALPPVSYSLTPWISTSATDVTWDTSDTMVVNTNGGTTNPWIWSTVSQSSNIVISASFYSASNDGYFGFAPSSSIDSPNGFLYWQSFADGRVDAHSFDVVVASNLYDMNDEFALSYDGAIATWYQNGYVMATRENELIISDSLETLWPITDLSESKNAYFESPLSGSGFYNIHMGELAGYPGTIIEQSPVSIVNNRPSGTVLWFFDYTAASMTQSISPAVGSVIAYSPTLHRFCTLHSGLASVSDDGGVNWSSQALSFSKNWSTMIWSDSGSGQFVALAYGNTSPYQYAATSPDGLNWTLRTIPAGWGTVERSQAITYSPELNLYVAINWFGHKMISSDAITWIAQPNFTQTAHDVIGWAPSYAGFTGRFVALSNFIQTGPVGAADNVLS